MPDSYERRCGALAAAVKASIVGKDDETSTAMFMDLDLLRATLDALKAAPFPPGTLHTFAIKANPVGRLLELMREAGMGAEVASLGELRQALHCGFTPDRIVFDSPIKTAAELRLALQAGVRLNLDNLQELERVAALLAEEPGLLAAAPCGADDGAANGAASGVASGVEATPGRGAAGQHGPPGAPHAATAPPLHPRLIGLRINPQVGEGSIAALSTGGRVSKFGVPLLEARGQVLAAFRRHPWLNALHLHVGSQGVPLELTAEGIARVAELAQEIEAEAEAAGTPGPRVLALDIGGGLPVQYGSDDLDWLLGSAAASPPPTAAAPAAAAAAASQQADGSARLSGVPPADADAAPAVASAISVFQRYAELLRSRIPALFGAPPQPSASSTPSASSPLPPLAPSSLQPPPPQLVTEFGRCLVARAAFAAGRVEYVKSCGGRRVVVSGLGGDLLLRAVYLPETWPVRVELAGPTGAPLPAAPPAPPPSAAGGACGAATAADLPLTAPTDVVGPLCFQGDRLADAVSLPPANPGDWVLVPDVGAYCLSMYSRYNSRCSPPVWGVWRVAEAEEGMDGVEERAGEGEAERRGRRGAAGRLPPGWEERAVVCDGYAFVLMRRGETVEEVMAFWNLGT